MKTSIERAIRKSGKEGKESLIRSSDLIHRIHEAVKIELLDAGIEASRIQPNLGSNKGELRVAGFLKNKNQDVAVLPTSVQPIPEPISFGNDGAIDRYGREFTERVLSINVRSQLSSLRKNFDTLYERTFAEALNLHLRCQRMCLGEVYLIPAFEYDSNLVNQRKIGYRQVNLEFYIKAFTALNLRRTTKGEEHKYERVCLLIVDFQKDQPKIYSSNEELVEAGLLRNDSTCSMKDLGFGKFIQDLLEVYAERFGKL